MAEGFAVIVPIVILMIVGAALRFIHFFDEHDVACMSKLVFWVISPVMLFRGAMRVKMDWVANLDLAMGIYLAAVLTAMIVFFAGKYLLRSPGDILPISVYTCFRSNSMMVGLPVVTLALGDAAMAAVAIYFAVTEVGYNFLTSLFAELVMASGGSKSRMLLKALRGVVRNPLVIGSAAGLAFSTVGIHALPQNIDKVFVIITNMAIGTSVLMIGASLKLANFGTNLKLLFSDAFVRFGLFPAIMLFALSLFSVSELVKQVTVLFSAASGANITFIMAREYGLNAQYSAEYIALTTLLFVVTMPVWLNILHVV